VRQQLEVVAGVKRQLEADAREIARLRLLDDRFMVIQHAMGCRKAEVLRRLSR
jgi:polar amino acid transport system substrate-binding protein